MKMTEQDYKEAATYAVGSESHLERWQIDKGMKAIEERRPLPYDVQDTILYYMDEWCMEQGFDEDAWMEWGSPEDIFLNFGWW